MRRFPRHLGVVLLALGLAAGASAQLPFTMSVDPNPVTVGSAAILHLRCTTGEATIATMPAVSGLRWLNGGQVASRNEEVRITNGRMTKNIDVGYSFVVTQAGTITLPQMTIRAGGKQYTSPALQIVAVAPQAKVENENVAIGDVFKFIVTWDGKEQPPEKVYTGQVLHVNIQLWIDHRLTIARQFYSVDNFFPKNEVNGLVWRDYGSLAKYNHNIIHQDPEQKVEGNRVWQVINYRMAGYAIDAGELTGSFELTVPVVQPNRNSSHDPFRLMMMGGSVQSIPLSAPIKLNVVPLPGNPPDGVPFLGLVGDWKVALTVDHSEVKLGQDVAMNLKVSGHGNIEGLTAPKMDLSGFNVYDPEVTRNVTLDLQNGSVQWVLVPRSVKSELPAFAFSTFDPVKGEYVRHDFKLPLTVLPGQTVDMGTSPRVIDSGTPGELVPDAAKTRAASDIQYIKKSLSAWVGLPLWRNQLALTIGATLLGPLACLLLVMLARRRERLTSDLDFRRRQEAARQRGKVIARLRKASPGDVPGVVRQEVVPLLAASQGLPPGTTVAELGDKLNDPELTAMLEAAQHASFMPGAAQAIDVPKLIGRISKLVIVMAAFLLATGNLRAATIDDAAAAYDKGNYAEAAAAYESMLRDDAANAALCYNLGNCAYAQGELGHAVAWYERALRLAPRDSAIIENLDFVRGQLNLPPIRQSEDPFSLLRNLRDHLRPDEWLAAAAVAWCLTWLLWGLLRWFWIRSPWAVAIPAALCVLCIIAAHTQRTSTYAPGQAVVVVDDAPGYRLPGQQDGKPKFALSEAEYVKVVEERTEWVRVRADQSEGWIRKSAIQMTW